MKSRAKFLIFSLLSLSLSVMLILTACKKDVDVGGGTEFNVTEAKLWGKVILEKAKVTVSPDATSKTLEIAVDNCSKYTGTVVFNGREYPINGNGGQAEVEIDDIPTTEKTLSVTLNASGYKEKIISVKVKRDEMSAPDFMVSFHKGDNGGSDIEINEENQPVQTAQTNGTLKISSPKVSMATLTIDGEAVTLTEGNNKNFTKEITGISAEKTITVAVTYKYYKPESRSFRLIKVGANELPLTLVSAKVFYGDNEKESKTLTFNASNEAETTLDKIRFSSVKLVMEFDAPLTSREVTSFESGRGNPYGSGQDDANNHFAGYITKEVHPGTMAEKALEPINGKVYTEYLLVGIGFAKFGIKVTGSNGKDANYTITIKNSNNQQVTVGRKGKFKLGIFNGWSSRPTFYGPANMFMLPYYNKGPNVKGQSLNAEGLQDFAYVDKLFIVFQETSQKPAPFVFYYNIFEKDKDKGEFMRMPAGKNQSGNVALALPMLDPNGKCLDACISFADTLPRGLFVPYCTSPFRKIAKPTRNYRLGLKNDVKCAWDTETNLDASLIFDYAFNYRRQTRYYEENNKNSTEKPLPIGIYQKVTDWEIGGDDAPAGWLPFLSKDGKDVFTFTPNIVEGDKKPSDFIEKVTHTIQTKKDDEESYEDVSDFKDVEPTVDANGVYTLGTKKDDSNKKHTFAKDKIYKVIVTVKYKESSVTEEKFAYIIDYKATESSKIAGPEFLSVGDLADSDSNLFGVPTHFGLVKDIEMTQPISITPDEIKNIKPMSIW